MDLNTITAVARPRNRAGLPVWTAGDAWLAGGTWLFSEPQVLLTRLIDLTDLKWPALTITESGLSIAATCTIAELDALACPPEWLAAPLFDQCCRAFLVTVTASTRRPVRLSFAKMPTADELREAILLRITDDRYHDDVHGKAEWRKHMTLRLAEEIRSELADAGEPMSSP